VIPDVTPVEEGYGSELTGVTGSDEAAKASGETKASTEDREMESQPAPEPPEEAVSSPTEETRAPDVTENTLDNNDVLSWPSVGAASPGGDEAPLEQDTEVMDVSADVTTPEPDGLEQADETPVDEPVDDSVMDVDGTVDAESLKEEEVDHVLLPSAIASSRRRESELSSADI
jgi:hypothetical protein